eukprot:1872862-Pleurochrysis_carterae.AAC.1
MSALASTFESYFQFAHEPLARRFVVLLEAFLLLAVEVGVAQRCLRKYFDDFDASRASFCGMTPKKSDCQLSLEKDVASRYRRDIVGVFGAIAFVAFGDDVECRVEAEDVAVFIGAKEKCLVELVELELEALETLILKLEPSRSRRAGAATVATELGSANSLNAVT